MSRPLWKGAISFGLVTIPVDLYKAVRDHRPRFRLLHAADRSPVRLERVCQRDGHPVKWDDLVKGYEYEKGRFVVLTKDDFKTAALEKRSTFDILDFVDAKEVDPRFFETSYYLAPGKGGDKSYALFREALRQSGRLGVGQIIFRDVQHLASLEVIDDALVVTMMRYADELMDMSTLSLPSAAGAQKAELKMAVSLIEHLSGRWSPAKYTDRYQQNLMNVIKGKLKGRKPELVKPKARRGEVVDLMQRLRDSLEAATRKPSTGARKIRKKRSSAAA